MQIENNIALISSIESNYKNLNTQLNTVDGEPRLYESEAIRCFTSWRKNGGWLKDIPIYCLCCTENKPSSKTKQILSDMGVVYIEDYCPDINKFSSGFLTIPYTGKYFESENRIKEDILIKIDLDNVLLKPFSKKMFEKIDKTTVVGQYNSDYEITERYCFDTFPFDTSLVITHKKNKFYEKYYDLCFSEDVLESNEWKRIKNRYGDYWLEEYVVDYMYKYNLKSITPIQNYQYGYGYPSLEYFIKNKLTNTLYMSHNHIFIRK